MLCLFWTVTSLAVELVRAPVRAPVANLIFRTGPRTFGRPRLVFRAGELEIGSPAFPSRPMRQPPGYFEQRVAFRARTPVLASKIRGGDRGPGRSSGDRGLPRIFQSACGYFGTRLHRQLWRSPAHCASRKPFSLGFPPWPSAIPSVFGVLPSAIPRCRCARFCRFFRNST